MTKSEQITLDNLIKDGFYAKGGFVEDNNIKLLSYEEGNLVLELQSLPKHYNGLGVIHGGVIFLLADTAVGLACIIRGRKSVTLSSNMNFFGNVTEGSIYTATRFIHEGGKTSVVEVTIHDGKGKKLAVGVFTFYRISDDK